MKKERKIWIGITAGVVCAVLAVAMIFFVRSINQAGKTGEDSGKVSETNGGTVGKEAVEAARAARNFKQKDANVTEKFADDTYYKTSDDKMHAFDKNGQVNSYMDRSAIEDETAENIGVDLIEEIAIRVFEVLTERNDYKMEEPSYSDTTGIYSIEFYHYINGYKSNDAIVIMLYQDGSLFSYDISGVTFEFENEEEIPKVDDAFIEDAVEEYFSGLRMEASEAEYTISDCMYVKEGNTLSFMIGIHFGDTIDQISVPLE